MRGGRLDNAKARKLCTKLAGSILKYFGVFADGRTQAPKKYDQQTLSKESDQRKRKKSEVKSRTKSSLTDRQPLQTHLIKSNLAMGRWLSLSVCRNADEVYYISDVSLPAGSAEGDTFSSRRNGKRESQVQRGCELASEWKDSFTPGYLHPAVTQALRNN
ncbi:hypothetical protein ALC56_01367 [Trachymyrmex septentrionalis]|uniref:Uncharacterized protein n=1 Tax=Trachymyrmex septentrionalis TaxID=34720 RepID=A0A151K0L4_9HYME|nr:hypothetical protein ALC56_01367 [Trachymyrmex septentrionalis]